MTDEHFIDSDAAATQPTVAPAALDPEPIAPPATPAKPPPRFDRSLVDGPLLPAVWKIALPTMLQNIIGGLQGIVDHVMVGHYVSY